MNKGIIFGLGALAGAAGGSIITYFVVNKKRDEEMDAYAEHCELRIERAKRKSEEKTEDEPEEEEQPTDDPNEDAINRNEGVKKYHHSDGLSSKYGENNIFGKKDTKPKKSPLPKLINEIEEEDFMNEEDGYAKETIDILLGDDSDIVAFWGYNTDNEEFVDKKFGKKLEVLIGETYVDYDYLLNLSDEEDSVGTLFIRNDNLMTDFAVVVHDMREEDK